MIDRRRAIDLDDAFTHGHRDRRRVIAELVALAGSAVAADMLIAGIGVSPASAAVVVAPDDPRLDIQHVTGTKAGAPAAAYVVGFRTPPAKKPPYVVVIHEDRGLSPHIQDVARRLALAGFRAIAPDLLAPQGGTPEDENKARDLIASLDYDLALAQVQEMIAKAAVQTIGNGRVGGIGFGWGGAFVDRLATVAGPSLRAAVAYDGLAPAPAEAAKVGAPLLLHYAALDARVAAAGQAWVAALKAGGKAVESYTYPGVNHAFNNDTAAGRYDAAAAALAWGRTVDFLHRQLDG